MLLGASGVAAQAETFTFTGTGGAPTAQITAPFIGGPKPVQAVFGPSTSQAIYASGAKTTSTSNCASWTTPPGQTFEVNGACLYTESNGDKTSIVFGCDFANKEQTASNCWGYLSGMAGARLNKTGTMSWHQALAADGKSSTFSGVGQWGD
jgi:hypothetical protein